MMDFDYKNILEHIHKAYVEAIKSGIKANTIIIDKGVAYINHIFVPLNFGGERQVTEIKPTIFGLEVEYADNLKEDFEANFVISRNERKEIERKEIDAKIKWYDLIIKKRVDINRVVYYCRNYNGYLAEMENDAVDEMMLTIEEWCKLKEIVGGVE